MAKKRTKRIKDEMEELENDEEETEGEEDGEELFSDIDGLMGDDEVQVSLYRKNRFGTDDYIGKLVPPVSIEMIKEEYGGGRYTLYATVKGKKGCRGKKVVSIAGPLKSDESPKSSFVQEPGSKETFVEIYRTIKELEGSNDDDKYGMGKMMAMMMSSQMAVMTQMQKMMFDNMKMMQEMGKAETGTTIPDLIKEGLDKIAEFANNILIAKSPNVAKTYLQGGQQKQIEGKVVEEVEEDMEIKKYKPLIDKLNTGFKVDEVCQTIKKEYPELILACKMSDFERVYGVLLAYGVRDDIKPALNELYNKMRVT